MLLPDAVHIVDTHKLSVLFTCVDQSAIYTVKLYHDSNTYGSVSMVDSISFLGPEEILQIAQENKYLGIF